MAVRPDEVSGSTFVVYLEGQGGFVIILISLEARW